MTRHCMSASALAASIFGITFLSACDSRLPNNSESHRDNDAKTQASVLALASPPNTAASNPWDARDVDVLAAARSRVPGSQLVLAAAVSTTTPCPDGGTTTQTTDNQPPPWFSQGDVYTTTYANCVRGTTELNGEQSFSVDVMTGQPYVDADWSMATTVAWKNLTRTTVGGNDANTVDGTMTEKTTVTNTNTYLQEFSGDSTRTRPNNGTTTTSTETYQISYGWDEVTRAYTWDFSVVSTSPIFGDEDIKSVQTFNGVLGQSPESGQFELRKTDLAGAVSLVKVTAVGGGNVRVETDRDNDGVVDSVETTGWNQLILNSLLYRFL